VVLGELPARGAQPAILLVFKRGRPSLNTHLNFTEKTLGRLDWPRMTGKFLAEQQFTPVKQVDLW
jgi:hypothetical protein